MKTALLDVSSWDLVLDASLNIAIASDPYSRAQDVASAIRTFAGECWYDTTLGVPHFQEILGKSPSLEAFKALIIRAALTVPGVVTADCIVAGIDRRTLTGSVPFTDVDGQTQTVQFA